MPLLRAASALPRSIVGGAHRPLDACQSLTCLLAKSLVHQATLLQKQLVLNARNNLLQLPVSVYLAAAFVLIEQHQRIRQGIVFQVHQVLHPRYQM